jgi:hypothetical protein
MVFWRNMVLLVTALALVAGQSSSPARMEADAGGNVHIATANATAQRIYLNGVDVLGELSRLYAMLRLLPIPES